MNQEVTLDLIKEEKPDSVIVASGSRTLILPIEGIDNPAIIHGSDLLDGKRAAGKKVLVVGGGMVGCETAAFLGEQNHDVTVIEFRDTVGADVIHEHRVYLMKDFEDYGIKEITGAKVCKFYEDGVEYETATVRDMSPEDMILLSFPWDSETTIHSAKKSKQLYRILM